MNDNGSTCLTSFPATLTGCNAALSEGRLDPFLLEDDVATSIRFNRFDAKRESSAVRGRFPNNGDIPDADNRGKDMIDCGCGEMVMERRGKAREGDVDWFRTKNKARQSYLHLFTTKAASRVIIYPPSFATFMVNGRFFVSLEVLRLKFKCMCYPFSI